MSGAFDGGDTPRFRSLLVVRLSAMGDVIHTLPAVAALRKVFPHIHIGWLIEERWAELLCTLRYPRAGRCGAERPLVDRVHTVNLGQFRRSPISFHSWQQIAVGLSELRGVRYDAAVDFQGAVRSALLARWSGAPVLYGNAQPRENAASMFYTRQVEASGQHVVEQALSLAQEVIRRPPGREASSWAATLPNGIPVPSTRSPHVAFPTDSDAEKRIESLTGAAEFAILNPGAGWGAKQWPVERYGVVAKELARGGMRSLVNYGPGEEKLAESVEVASEGAAQKVVCSIAELISLTRRARLFIGGDTGPMHLAAALKVPVVAIFGPTNPARNGPFGTRSIVLRSASSLTDHTRHRKPEHGLLEITPQEVVAAARKLLGEPA
ncbi:MAG TPA: glycosyltransferase family 9 protein [Terriglobales bacterium]|nr:glycosyltransferase family 9 protein [Terriglobales bacterium]